MSKNKAIKRKGIVIAIDGPDGAGKTTQAGLLYKYLKSVYKRTILVQRPSVQVLKHKTAGKDTKEIALSKCMPYINMRNKLWYTEYAYGFTMEELYEQGYILIFDRYIASNITNVSNVDNVNDRSKVLNTCKNIEKMLIPFPDVSISMVANDHQNLIDNINKRGQEKDINELDDRVETNNHLFEFYHDLFDRSSKVVYIDDSKGKIKSKEDVCMEIIEIINKAISTYINVCPKCGHALKRYKVNESIILSTPEYMKVCEKCKIIL